MCARGNGTKTCVLFGSLYIAETSAHLQPMFPGFDSRTWRHMWVDQFVVGSLRVTAQALFVFDVKFTFTSTCTYSVYSVLFVQFAIDRTCCSVNQCFKRLILNQDMNYTDRNFNSRTVTVRVYWTTLNLSPKSVFGWFNFYLKSWGIDRGGL